MNGVLPIALLGVAAFFVYRYYSTDAPDAAGGGSTSLPGPGGSTAPPGTGAGAGSPTGPATGGSSGGGSTAPGTGTVIGSSPQLSQAEILQGAAVGVPELVMAADAKSFKLNIDQWNWYREQAGAEPIDPSYMPTLIGDMDRATMITASEYRRRLASNGLGYLIPVDVLRWQ